ncbi:hypothetical protein QAD02_014206 [Eretmocerus hayati]|uniref:Uncharacterized protein n=1 Tax=Eretmocerus hayati TaxID=131215 RepID=A0ACC2P535_9HYME|nr:hypothetical protein QAD02_014206 [Eretmocerus hayati]
MKQKIDESFVKASSENLPRVDLIISAAFLASSEFKSCEMENVNTGRSMRANYGDMAVGYVQLKRTGDTCTVEARICPEHKTNSKNYNVKVIIDEVDEKIEVSQCEDCAASQEGCKHAVAVVAWIYRKTEEPAPTSVVCYWNKPALSRVGSKINYLTIEDMLAGKRNNSYEQPRDSRSPENKDFLRSVYHDDRAKNCAQNHLFQCRFQTLIDKLTLHHQSINYSGNETDVEEFLELCKQIMTPENCKHAFKMTLNQSNSHSWFQLKYGRVTVSIIHDAAKCKTLDGTLVEKILSTMNYDSPAMKRGRELEGQVIASLGEFLTQKYKESPVRKCGLILSKEYPVLGASPDGMINVAVIEIKCPAEEKTVRNYYDGVKITNKYKAQIQLQMLFAQKSEGYFCIADPKFETNKKVTIIEGEFNKDFIMRVVTQAMEIWKSAVFPHSMKK